MQKILIILLLVSQMWAGFEFGECSGSGTFEQPIAHYQGDYERTTSVGIIPKGIKGLQVELISPEDVDIRLYGENKDKIVHWPSGLLHTSSKESKTYKDVVVEYSGFNGLNGKRGYEYIKIEQEIPIAMEMKAFGYRAGKATVNYSWTGKKGCTPSQNGSGKFTQKIAQKEITLVGTIPPNISDVMIDLSSSKDIDIQLYAKDGTPIVSWKPKGILSGSGKQTTVYDGMTIEWSGYNGVEGKSGHEYIKISGKTSQMLVMKVYGYVAGDAEVNYSWGEVASTEEIASKYGIATQGTMNPSTTYYKPAKYVLDHNDTSYNHTTNSNENWVQVAFPATVTLKEVRVKIGLLAHAYRLKNAKVYLQDTPHHTGDTFNSSDMIGTLKDTAS